MEARLALDGPAFDARYPELLADLRRVCLGMGAGADAEDIAQDVLIYARGRLHELRDDTRLMPWLRRIAVRWTRRRDEHGRAGAIVSDIGGALVGVDLRLDERDALAELSPRQRQVILLVYFGGFRQEEVAQMLEISRGNVGRTLWDARCALAAKLANYGPDVR